MVQVQLPLGWNTYLLFNSDIVKFVEKPMKRETESIVFVDLSIFDWIFLRFIFESFLFQIFVLWKFIKT